MSDEYRLRFWNDGACLRNVSQADEETYASLKEHVLALLRDRQTRPSMARRLLRTLADQATFLPVRISFLDHAAGGPRTLPSEPKRFRIDLPDGGRQVVIIRPLTRLNNRVIEAELAQYYLWYGDTLTSGMPFQLHYKNYPMKLIGNGVVL